MNDDICERLHRWAHAVDAVPASDLMDEAADEIARMRGYLEESEARASLLELAIRKLAAQDATLSVCDGNVTVTMDATLTDAEREAVAWCRDSITAMAHPSSAFAHIHAAALRALLERTK